MIPTSKTNDIDIASLRLDKQIEEVSREKIAQLRENISTLVHEYFALKLSVWCKDTHFKSREWFFCSKPSYLCVFQRIVNGF